MAAHLEPFYSRRNPYCDVVEAVREMAESRPCTTYLNALQVAEPGFFLVDVEVARVFQDD